MNPTDSQFAALDRQLATKAGIASRGRIILQFYPPEAQSILFSLEQKHAGARKPETIPSAASIYSQVPFDQDTSFLIIGERANANGSRAFKESLLADDLDGCVSIGQDQVKEGAHLVDLCVDYVGRDGVADMLRLAAAFATDVAAPSKRSPPTRPKTFKSAIAPASQQADNRSGRLHNQGSLGGRTCG